MLTRLENFGAGGVNYDLFETGLGTSQWSGLTNVDIRDGDLYSAGADVSYSQATPVLPLYVFLYEVEGTVVDMISDGNELYASVDDGAWSQIGANLGGGPVGFTVFRGCLIVNTGVGPFYWCSLYGSPQNDTWDDGPDVAWEASEDTDWANIDGNAGDTWANGPDETWAAGVDDAWDGTLSGSIVALPGWPEGATALQVIAYKDQLVAIGGADPNLPSGQPPYLVRWSSLAPAGSLPETWEPEEGNFAGFAMVQDTQGELSGAALMRDDLILYKTDSIWRLSATGDPVIPMRLERIMICNGIQAPDAVCVCSEVHFGVTKRGFMVFDGNQARYLDFGRVQTEITKVLIGDTFSSVAVRYFSPTHEVWIAFRYPADAQTYAGILKYNTQHNSFTLHEYAGVSLISLAVGRVSEEEQVIDSWQNGDETSWDAGADVDWDDTAPAATADAMILGVQTGDQTVDTWDGGENTSWDSGSDILWSALATDRVGQLARYDLFGSPTYYNGSAKPTEALRHGVRPSDSDRFSVLRGVYPEMEGDPVTWEVGLTWYPSQDKNPGEILWQPARSFTPAQRRKIPTRIVGDTFAFRVRGVDGGRWRLHAMALDHDIAGRS
jgi:hypothetical protein